MRPSRLDITMSILSVVLVGGFYVDLWAHSHGRVDDSFFTPYHGVLYLGAGLYGAVLLVYALRNRSPGTGWRESVPEGYGLSLIGAGLFLIAGLGDLVWHEVFGIEIGVEELLSPTHLALALSGVLMVAGPLRAAWLRGIPKQFPHWVWWALALTMLLSIFTAFTSYAHPAVDVWPAEPAARNADSSALLVVDTETGAQTRFPLDIGESVWLPDVFPDGSRIVVSAASEGTGALFILQEGRSPLPLWVGDGPFNHPSVSPDGTLIAFTAETEDGGADIFVIPAVGGEPVQLTDDPSFEWGSKWSPDGTELAFVSDRDGDLNIYLMDADGGNVRRITPADADDAAPAWSPDGSRIAYQSNPDGNLDIFLMNPDGTGVTQLTDDPALDQTAAWSPDGSLIAFSSDRDGDLDIYTMPAGGGPATKLSDNPSAHEAWAGMVWTPDGASLVTNTSGWSRPLDDQFVREALGVASLLLQSLLIAGVLLFMLRSDALPTGAITLVLTVNAALMTVFADNYWYIVPALIAGVAGDLLAVVLRDGDPTRRARLLAFAVPAVWYALYLVLVALTQNGIGWSIHMLLGTPLLAGAAGLLMSYVVFPLKRRTPAQLAQ